MRKFNLFKEHLVEGQKVTLVFQGEFGGLTAIPTTYLGCKPAPYYQNCYEDMIGVAVLHKPRCKRKAGYKTFVYNTPLVVYDGWQNIHVDELVFQDIDVNLKMSRYTMFDDRYFTGLLAARPDGVIFADVGGRQDG